MVVEAPKLIALVERLSESASTALKDLTGEEFDTDLLGQDGLADAPVLDRLCSHFVLTLTLRQLSAFSLRRDWAGLLGLVGRHLVWPAPVLSSCRFTIENPSSNVEASIRLAVASEWWNSESPVGLTVSSLLTMERPFRLCTPDHTQPVVPHITDVYSSQHDAPDASIPVCTLKLFPSLAFYRALRPFTGPVLAWRLAFAWRAVA